MPKLNRFGGIELSRVSFDVIRQITKLDKHTVIY